MMQTMPIRPQVEQQPATGQHGGEAKGATQENAFGQVLAQTHQQHPSNPAESTPKKATSNVQQESVDVPKASSPEATSQTATTQVVQSELDDLLTPDALQQAKALILGEAKNISAKTTDAEAGEDPLTAAYLPMVEGASPVAKTVQQLMETLPENLQGVEAATKEALKALRQQLQSSAQGASVDPSLQNAEIAQKKAAGAVAQIQVIEGSVENNAPQQTMAMLLGQKELGPQKQASAAMMSDVAKTAEPLVAEHKKAEMDPRFASLLNPGHQGAEQGVRGEAQLSLRQAQAQAQTQAQGAALENPEMKNVTEGSEAAAKATAEAAVFAKALGRPADSAGNVLHTTSAASHAPSVVPSPVQSNVAAPATMPTMQLPTSGHAVAETMVVDQVVAQLRGSVNGETGQMVLRLKPAELGEVKLDLIVENDKVKASLHAQTHQVQEVIERHLPRLRSALEQQGLRVDDFKVTADADQSGGREDLYHHQQHQQTHQGHQGLYASPMMDWEEVPVAVTAQGLLHPGGVNLHV